MSRYCLDTSAYIQFRRGDPQTTAAIDGASWLGFPAIALGELYTGFCLTGQRRSDLALQQWPQHTSQRRPDDVPHPVTAPKCSIRALYGRPRA